MKKVFTSLFLCVAIAVSAQTDTLRTKGRKNIPTIIGKWQLDSVSGSSKTGLMPRTLELLENGDYTDTGTLSGTIGKWKIENGAIIRDTKLSTIENLTMKKMVLSELENKKKVFYFFSRMNYITPAQDVIPH